MNKQAQHTPWYSPPNLKNSHMTNKIYCNLFDYNLYTFISGICIKKNLLLGKALRYR
jgi:hypothetical protein